MRYLTLVAALLLLLSSCEAYLEEKLEFLELPFEYEGQLRDNNFNPDWDLAWGVPDNGDGSGVYLCTFWGGLFYLDDGNLFSLWFPYFDPLYRRIVSLDRKGWFVQLFESGANEGLALMEYDFTNWMFNDYGTQTPGYVFGTTSITVYNNIMHLIQTQGDPVVAEWLADTGTGTLTYNVNLLNLGDVLLSDIVSAAFPEADTTWGPVSVDFLAFAPATLASWNGKHKFILARSDGSTGERKVMLVSVDETDYSLSVRRLSAERDFHFVSRDRFVGMDGETLKIFNSTGEELADYELEGMRLLGYRSSTDPELVFLYRSEEDGDRVYGIYSLPAAFVREAR
ncbi:hypothetical protein B4O97_07205 [Marispirochaeta aestuarii]|uniref:Uncharacterized protein n=1 Tax=Marispirochaeta aestuarii TaxID=1963862 RepID=A0A1Y1RYW9_9SPIO|nr:hypothetical protein [Marispirochaeta aestuarii]ORC35850.1 hypothetical protein B4O97_07205 [Marispirochaeta aestuarii]